MADTTAFAACVGLGYHLRCRFDKWPVSLTLTTMEMAAMSDGREEREERDKRREQEEREDREDRIIRHREDEWEPERQES